MHIMGKSRPYIPALRMQADVTDQDSEGGSQGSDQGGSCDCIVERVKIFVVRTYSF